MEPNIQKIAACHTANMIAVHSVKDQHCQDLVIGQHTNLRVGAKQSWTLECESSAHIYFLCKRISWLWQFHWNEISHWNFAALNAAVSRPWERHLNWRRSRKHESKDKINEQSSFFLVFYVLNLTLTGPLGGFSAATQEPKTVSVW